MAGQRTKQKKKISHRQAPSSTSPHAVSPSCCSWRDACRSCVPLTFLIFLFADECVDGLRLVALTETSLATVGVHYQHKTPRRHTPSAPTRAEQSGASRRWSLVQSACCWLPVSHAAQRPIGGCLASADWRSTARSSPWCCRADGPIKECSAAEVRWGVGGWGGALLLRWLVEIWAQNSQGNTKCGAHDVRDGRVHRAHGCCWVGALQAEAAPADAPGRPGIETDFLQARQQAAGPLCRPRVGTQVRRHARQQ